MNQRRNQAMNNMGEVSLCLICFSLVAVRSNSINFKHKWKNTCFDKSLTGFALRIFLFFKALVIKILCRPDEIRSKNKTQTAFLLSARRNYFPMLSRAVFSHFKQHTLWLKSFKSPKFTHLTSEKIKQINIQVIHFSFQERLIQSENSYY